MVDIERERAWIRQRGMEGRRRRIVAEAIATVELAAELAAPCPDCGHAPHRAKLGGLRPCYENDCDCAAARCECDTILAKIGGYPTGTYACPSCERQYERFLVLAAIA